MSRNVEIISKEMIKPSSPTPTHLKTLKLSFLDQIATPVYVPLIFFYHPQNLISNPKQISASLKQSLSKILTIFYPLAGIVQENSWVDCNDSGAEFSEARVGARLSDVIQDEADVEELNKLLPVDSLGQDEKIILRARLNFFECGGVAVAVCLWHKIADGASMVAFVESWAATCRGETKIIHPSFDMASFFPPRPISETLNIIQVADVITSEKIVTKRFVFSKEKIAKLKETCFNDELKKPTRVEAVSSYMWRTFIEAAKASPQTTSLFVASNIVNLRPRRVPPISQHVFGNCWRPAVALSGPEEDHSEVAVKFRAAVTSIDDDFIKQVGSDEFVEGYKRKVEMRSMVGIEIVSFSSWCSFPTYEVDFGWGKPVRVCTATRPFKNTVILMGTPCGEGIEAWVNMLQHDMQVFQHDLALLELS